MQRTGPLVICCMRMEAKNSYFKKVAKISNSKNVPYSVQLNMLTVRLSFLYLNSFTQNLFHLIKELGMIMCILLCGRRFQILQLHSCYASKCLNPLYAIIACSRGHSKNEIFHVIAPLLSIVLSLYNAISFRVLPSFRTYYS